MHHIKNYHSVQTKPVQLQATACLQAYIREYQSKETNAFKALSSARLL